MIHCLVNRLDQNSMAIFSKNRKFFLIYNQISVSRRKISKFSNKSSILSLAQRGNYLNLEKIGQILKNERSKQYSCQIIATQIRYQSQQTNTNNNESIKKKPFLRTSILYSLSIIMGGLLGILTGYWLMSDESQIENDNESVRSKNVYESTKVVSSYC